VIVTEWEQFRALDFKRLKSIMAKSVLVDLRNIYRPEEVLRHGFSYESIGRARVDTPENLTRRASDRK
jgi:UDPglucose 6-dehydrogenase